MSLRQNLETLESDELFDKVRSSSLTEEADTLARDILSSRGITPPVGNSHHDAALESYSFSKTALSFFSACIKGEARLASAFWILGLLVSGSWIFFLFLLSLTQNRLLTAIFESGLIASLLGGSVFYLVCVWRCSENTDLPLWSYLAKSFVLFKSSIFLVLFAGAFFW